MIFLVCSFSFYFNADIYFLISYMIMQDGHTKGCKCPPGFRGDGANSCEGTLTSKICLNCSNINNSKEKKG